MQAPIREIPRVSLAIRKRGRPSPPSLAEAVEKELRFRELKGKTGLGYVNKPD